ncbi:MAG: outer membrane protein assembly factor BamE [Rhodoferax sp.]|nr:outer membrane protein assembly factor BamE [Rhodoferax sp.]MDP3651391.1 outer membrane protein assembly factor BamE [Rhodoferax sp.]
MELNHQVRQWSVVVGLALGAIVANAQDGFTVSPYQESLVKPGMSKSEVQQVIGRPSRDASYGVAPGSTWVYGITGRVNDGIAENNDTVFEVDFGSDGRVISAKERVLPSLDHGSSTGF